MISASVAVIMNQVRKVYHWKTAKAFAMLMEIAKDLNTGPGVVGGAIHVQIRIRPQHSLIQGTHGSPRLFTKKVTTCYKECIW